MERMIVVKGMEIPESCDECPLLTEDGDYNVCFVGKRRVMWEWKHDRGSEVIHPKPDWCPLVPVPPHGRLIDADAFIKGECNICDGACDNTYCDCLSCEATMRCEMIKDFANAPTVIEADKDGET